MGTGIIMSFLNQCKHLKQKSVHAEVCPAIKEVEQHN